MTSKSSKESRKVSTHEPQIKFTSLSNTNNRLESINYHKPSSGRSSSSTSERRNMGARYKETQAIKCPHACKSWVAFGKLISIVIIVVLNCQMLETKKCIQEQDIAAAADHLTPLPTNHKLEAETTTTPTDERQQRRLNFDNYQQQHQQQRQHQQPLRPRNGPTRQSNTQPIRSGKLVNLIDDLAQISGESTPTTTMTTLGAAVGRQPVAPEEFSTGGASGLAPGAVASSQAPPEISDSFSSQQQQQQASQLAPTSSTTTTTTSSTQATISDPASSSSLLISDDEQQPAGAANTTPSNGGAESLGSPPTLAGAQSSAATSTQPSSPVPSSGGRLQSAASGRRMDNERTFGPAPTDGHASQQQQQAAPIISGSSISIITPLAGPPTQQQQQLASSSSMVKPIYVMGQPLSELDYGSTGLGQLEAPVVSKQPAARSEKRAEATESLASQNFPMITPSLAASGSSTIGGSAPSSIADQSTPPTSTASSNMSSHPAPSDDRMSGPTLFYSDGSLLSSTGQQQQPPTPPSISSSSSYNNNNTNSLASQLSNEQLQQQTTAAARLLQASGAGSQQAPGAALLASGPRRPSLPPPVNQANAASGFRSPVSPGGPLVGQPTGPIGGVTPPAASGSGAMQLQQQQQQQQQMFLQPPVNQMANFYQTSPPYASGPTQQQSSQGANGAGQLFGNSLIGPGNRQATFLANSQQPQPLPTPQAGAVATTPTGVHQQQPGAYQARRPLNITRVEHISAECSNDLIRAVIVFNGTFKGIIYSSGYVNDPTCLYVNGTGATRYEFSIRLNQCGTLGRQEVHQPTLPGDARRRDQVMWNSLSIQYNSIIEQEWDEHYRVSCEYGSDFWKTVSFSPFNVETNTGSPVVFTINPPQCQMDVLLGHGMGPKIVDGPVTVGDPLTLLIHMKSEKAGYDILVKNCVAHNGGKQRMQLIDSNGCVVNERFISPFRGTYNDNDLRHVTLYAYLKAFRFTGSPVLYLECEIHMCLSACPPQMCYWRRLSKRSVDNNDFEYTDPASSLEHYDNQTANQHQDPEQFVSDSLSLFKALQVRNEPIQSQALEKNSKRSRSQQMMMQNDIYGTEADESQLICYRHAEVLVFITTIGSLLLLILSVALTCCWRIRKLTRSQFKHNRLRHQVASATAASLSPSLLSISGFSNTVECSPSSSLIASSLSPPLHSPNNNNNNNNSNSKQAHPLTSSYMFGAKNQLSNCNMTTLAESPLINLAEQISGRLQQSAVSANQKQQLASYANGGGGGAKNYHYRHQQDKRVGSQQHYQE